MRCFYFIMTIRSFERENVGFLIVKSIEKTNECKIWCVGLWNQRFHLLFILFSWHNLFDNED